MTTPGVRAPEFHVPLVGGGFRGLADLVEPGGGIVLFVKSDCPSSRLVASHIGPLARALEKEGRLFLAVVQESEKGAAAFRADGGVPGVLAYDDAPHAASLDFDITTVPTLLVVDGAGIVAERIEGFVKRDYTTLGETVEQALALGDVPPVLERLEELPEIKPG